MLYKAFGYNIASEFALPELLAGDPQKQPDFEIRQGDLTELWESISREQVDAKFAIVDQMVVFQVPHTAVFAIEKSGTILVSPLEQSVEDKLRLFILGTCMGVVLMQRKVLPLHGSALAINGKAYAFVGHSGAGKSTLATVLLHQGYRLLSDDVIAVSLQTENQADIIPSYPQQKLWRESIHYLGMEQSTFRPLFERENKFIVPVRSQFCQEPLPFAGVIELVKTEGKVLRMDAIHGLARLNLLYRHTYRKLFILPMGLLEWHFHACTHLSKRLEMYAIQRPVGEFNADKLASLIMGSLNKEA